jgi:hypothetical protein
LLGVIFDPEDGGNNFLRNILIYQNYTEIQSRKMQSLILVPYFRISDIYEDGEISAETCHGLRSMKLVSSTGIAIVHSLHGNHEI